MEARRPRRPALPARLFWRVYLNGLLLLLLVGLAVAAVGSALRHAAPGGGRNPGRFAEFAAERVSELRGHPHRLGRELARVHDAFGAEVTVYGPGGEVLATNVDPPLPPLPPDDAERVLRGSVRATDRHHTFAAPIEGVPGAYLLLSGSIPTPSLLRAASFLMAALLALAVASIPLARAISRPLERLGVAVRAFGAGDLSARARLPARGEVGEVARAFDEMAGRIEALLRSEKELLANVSHELRTPLARARVALDLAAEGDLERSRRYLAEIGADLNELESLVEDVLAAARLDLAAGRDPGAALPLRCERVDAKDLVVRAAERFRTAHPDRPLDVRIAEPLPDLVADPGLLRRVLDNLLDNARKYSDGAAPVTLVARGDGGALAVEVRDQGIGIDDADLERLFTPFFRTDRSRARGTGGVGLGLALARKVVEAHGGRIAAESAPGEGTAIRFSVPGGGAS
ncbi:MAG: sensor histidine kinase [Anaeromyxobacteraceae bacterium]